jgi:hypothetical protein
MSGGSPPETHINSDLRLSRSSCDDGGFMVLQERIELSTSPLPRECSTTELLQRRVSVRGGPRDVAGD